MPNLSSLLNKFRLGKKEIDIDKISLENLIIKHFKYNIPQLVELAHIVRDAFNHSAGDAWKEIKDRSKEYIKQCEAQKKMKVVY